MHHFKCRDIAMMAVHRSCWRLGKTSLLYALAKFHTPIVASLGNRLCNKMHATVAENHINLAYCRFFHLH